MLPLLIIQVKDIYSRYTYNIICIINSTNFALTDELLVPVEFVTALVPLDLIEPLPLEVVVAGEVDAVAGQRHLRHVQSPDLHSRAG